MKDIVNFGIELPFECFKHIEEMSYYDHNYYKIKNYGDWFYGDLDILLIQYNECENCYSYQLGKMVDGKFKAVIYWTNQRDILE